MMTAISPLDKKTLRAQCLAARAAIDPAVAQLVCRHLVEAIGTAPQMVAGYRAIRGELDIAGAMEALERAGHTLCLPVIAQENAPLVFRRWQVGQALEKGAFDIEIPLSASEPYVHPDTIVVPLLAFDAKLHRLGYGAGYYDRTIAQARAAKKQVRIIGAAYSMQRLESIPAEAHDERLDAVVTEKGILSPPNGGVR